MTASQRSGSQLTLSFDATLAERWATLREFIAFRAQAQAKKMATIAADMDLSPTTLSRKLNPKEDDTQRFNLDDLEAYIQSTGDVGSVIEYLAAKYGQSDEVRRTRAIARVEQLLPALEQALAQIKA